MKLRKCLKIFHVIVNAIISGEKIIDGIAVHVCENNKYLKSVANTSVTKCDEIVIVMYIALTKMANTIATNVISTASINCHSKKVRDCYVLHAVL